MLRLILMLCVFYHTIAQDISFVEDIRALSELPLEKLLHIKKSFDIDEDIVPQSSTNSSEEFPQALALQSKKIPKEREVYHYDDTPSKDKSTSIQSIFQISITTLAFLAFGGYLICLLVQAVKGKSNNYQTTATQIMSALVSQRIRRRTTRAPYRRQKKPTNRYGYGKRRPRPKREVLPDLDVESMYYSLINLSEGYTKYHTEDYSRYNFSSNYF